MNSFYWHDYETWGSRPSVDKAVQFAGVRTDTDLQVLGEPLVTFCRPAADCIPQPLACIVTGITPQQALAEGGSEAEFFQQIHAEFSQPQTCAVGYNSIRFDDEVTRYGFYRNFYDPYEREWKNGNSRWDIIDMVRLVYALRPDTLHWPMREEGIPSFKLEALSQANGIEHLSAHDALSDVYATIGLARLIKERQPKLYEYALSLRNKKTVASYIDLQQGKPLFHISSRYPASRGCAALVMPLMWHPKNSNSVICYDLSVDPEPLIQLSSDEVAERVFVKQADLPASLERIPLKEIHLNKSPIVATPKLLDRAAAERLAINKDVCDRHWQQLRAADLQTKLSDIYGRQVFPPAQDPEQQLYDGFINDHDRQLLPAIRSAQPEQLSRFTEQLKDERLQTLLFRYRARNFPQTLSADETSKWEQWCYWRVSDPEAGGSLVLNDYFEQLEELSQQEGVDQALIQQLIEYGDGLLV